MKVSIDGPSGAGKSSVARAIAKRKQFLFLDTGATYRCVALMALRNGLDLNDEAALGSLASSLQIEFSDGPNDQQLVWLNGEDVTSAIRAAEVNAAVSVVSKFPSVRSAMVALQRSIAQGTNTIAEGRDIGTVVFPDAEVKVFLTADEKMRAHRRAEQDKAAGRLPDHASEEEVRKNLAARDKQDSERKESPLVAAHDAVVIDSTVLTFAETVAAVERLIEAACVS